nr:MAG TPA: hypothetical protein [Caudoviricetes sp.]
MFVCAYSFTRIRRTITGYSSLIDLFLYSPWYKWYNTR